MNQQEAKNTEHKVQTTRPTEFVAKPYIELPGKSSELLDPLSQLRSNVEHIEKLQAKMSFMVREIQSLSRKR